MRASVFLVFRIAFVVASISSLSSCSSGGNSQTGLGLELGGFWTGTLTQSHSGRTAGTVNFGFQNTVNALTGVTSSPKVTGTFTYENALVNECPILSAVGDIQGTVTGNTLIMSSTGSSTNTTYTLNMSAQATNQQMVGDWNLSFNYPFESDTGKVDIDGDPITEEIDTTCRLFGTWRGTRRGL